MEFAKTLHGDVPAWDNTYIDKYMPPELLVRMKDVETWQDADGFQWGFRYVRAIMVEGEPCISVAQKWDQYEGYILKVVSVSGFYRNVHV